MPDWSTETEDPALRKDSTMPAILAAGFAAPSINLTQDYDDYDRFTTWTVARAAEGLDSVTSVGFFEDFRHITEGISAERATLTREDGNQIDLVLTADLELDAAGEPGLETITGWGIRPHGTEKWNFHAHDGTLDALYKELKEWATLTPDDGITPLTGHVLDEANGTLITVMWKPLEVAGVNGGSNTAWGKPSWPPVRFGLNGKLVGEVFISPSGMCIEATPVDSPSQLRPGKYVILPDA